MIVNRMTRVMIFLMGAFYVPLAFSAAPITHAVIPQKWMHYKEHYQEKQQRAFLMGTLFPDIRYLALSRARKG